MPAPKFELRRGPATRPPGLIFVTLFLLPVVGWLYYNYWDQALEPGAKLLLEAPHESVPDAENLFLALLAFPIEGEEPAHERGASALAAYDRSIGHGGQVSQTYATALDRASARFDEGELRLCSPGNHEEAYACMALSRAQRPALELLVAHLRPLLLRYRELERYPRYSDPRLPAIGAAAPDASAFRIGMLHLSVLAWMAQAGALDQAAAALARSAAIWRRVLTAQDAGIVDKMLAARAYTAHLLFASELIRATAPADTPLLDPIEPLLRPLSEAERSVGGALAIEFRMQARTWDQVVEPYSPVTRADFPDTSAWYYRFLIKKNESINRTFRDLQEGLAIERAGCVEIKRRAGAASLAPPDLGIPWYEYFYNPIGRVLHAMGGGINPHLDYFGRQCNLLALQGMVGLQLELRRSGATPDNTAAQMQALAAKFQDPNSGQPFAYDTSAQTLAFDFIGPRKDFVTPLPLAAP